MGGRRRQKRNAAEIVARLNTEINAALNEPDIRARLHALAAEPMIVSPAEISAYLRAEKEKWMRVIAVARIRR